MNRTSLIVVISFISLIIFNGCAGPKVRQKVVMPAKAEGMTKTKKLAVTAFDGDRHSKFTSRVETFFANIRINGKPYFTVVDRGILSTILKEQRMVSESGLFNENDAVKLGQLSGADTIVTGSLTWPIVENSSYHEERTKCVKKNKNKCIENRTYRVNCNKKQARLEYTLKAISVARGDITYTKSYQGKSESKRCSDATYAQKSNSELTDIAWNNAINAMRNDVAPYVVEISIQLMDSDDSELKNNAEAQKLLKSGIEFTKANRLDRGCQQFRKALGVYNKSPALFYNVGVCSEVEGDLDQAETFYNKADQLTLKPNKVIGAALSRLSERRMNNQALQTQKR